MLAKKLASKRMASRKLASKRFGISSAISNGLHWIIGDSLGVGVPDFQQSDLAFAVSTPFAAVTLDTRYATGVIDPPTWIDVAARSLQPYAAGGSSNMGFELTLGRQLYDLGVSPYVAKQAISGSTLAVEWLPGGAYPTVGGSLVSQWIARARALEASTSKVTRSVTICLGSNDAGNATWAAAFAANMASLIATVKASFPRARIVWIKTHVSTTAANLATVRAAQVAVAAADSTIALLDWDDGVLSDGVHPTADSAITVGQRAAYAITDRAGIARPSVSGASPAVIGYGTAERGAGALTVRGYPGIVDGDLEYMMVTTGLLDVAISAPSGGWTAVAGTDQVCTFTTLKQRCQVFQRTVTSALLAAGGGRMASTTIPDTNNFNAAKIFAVRSPSRVCSTNASGGGVNDAFGLTSTIPSVTTTIANALILRFGGGYSGGANSISVADAGLTSVSEVQDGTHAIGSDYQMISLTTGIKVAAGATGAATITSAASMMAACATVAVVSA